jgi:hypothetical protein
MRSDHKTDAFANSLAACAERIKHKIIVLTSKCFVEARRDTWDHSFVLHICLIDGALQSAGLTRLLVPPIKLSTVGRPAFHAAGSQVWNDLVDEVMSLQSLWIFPPASHDLYVSEIPSAHNDLTASVAYP